MAEDQVAGPAVEAGESPALRQQAAAPGTVSVSVTYTRADIRSILLMAMPRLTLVFGVVMVALWVLVLMLGLALGASLSWDDAQLPGLLLLFAVADEHS
ncbi:MAG TPA: hypothetical protein VFP72_10185 [Kineosporiaceae bacterium]|nr:hypothetical protein [Kineosporiaceae bacterium]